MICSGGVGGTIGVGWVLLLQAERGRRAFKFYAIKICKSVVQLLHVWMPASNLSMPIYNAKRFSACWAGLGVQLVSLRCLVIVEEWSIDFSLVKWMMNYYTNIAVASFQEGLQCNHLGYHCSSTWKAIQNNCRWNWQGIC